MRTIDLVVLGSYVQDHVFVTDRAPDRGETVIGRFATVPGGKGFNQAIAAHRQGARVCFIGALGRDGLGEYAQSYAKEDGLVCDWEIRDDAATGAAGIVVDAHGDNRIVVALGANEKLSRQFLLDRKRLVRDAKVVLTQFETNADIIAELFRLANEHTVVSILNPAPMNPAIVSRELIAMADIVTPNETEFAGVIERFGGSAEAIRAARAAAQLSDPMLHALCRSTGIPTLVVTLGEYGCFVSHADATVRKDADAYYRIAPESVRAVDTTGAGDAFSGALAAAMLLFHFQHPFRKCVEHANRVAALSTEKAGAATSMPTRAEVNQRFRSL